jgi:hypothetical protein
MFFAGDPYFLLGTTMNRRSYLSSRSTAGRGCALGPILSDVEMNKPIIVPATAVKSVIKQRL